LAGPWEEDIWIPVQWYFGRAADSAIFHWHFGSSDTVAVLSIWLKLHQGDMVKRLIRKCPKWPKKMIGWPMERG